MNCIKSKPVKLVFLLSALLYLASCAVGPKFERPQVETPKKFINDSLVQTDSLLQLKWWELFNDPVLDSLIELALTNNKDLLITASKIEQSRATLGIQRADFYPGIRVGASAVQGNFGGGFLVFPDTREALSVNGQLSWELDVWGKIRRSTESAKADLLASEYGKRTVQIGIISEVARTYFLLLDYYSRYEISIETEISRDSANDIIVSRFEGGIAPEIDVNQSQIQLAISRAAIPVFKREITRVENNLNFLLGQNPGQLALGKSLFEQEINPVIPAGLPSTLLERRPDLLQAEAKLHAQTALIGAAQASRLPSFNLTGLLGTVSQDLTSFNAGQSGWNVSAGLLGPLFEFGRNKRRVEVEREKTKQALLEYEKSVLIAFNEVELALISIETIREELEAREFQYTAAANAEMLAFERYNGGVTSYLEVLENQRSSFEAELLYSQTYSEYLNAHISLYKALGGGYISEAEMKSTEGP